MLATEPILLADDSDTFSATLTTLLAVIAFLMSLYTHWATQWKPFRPVFLVMGPTLRFFHCDRSASAGDKAVRMKVWEPFADAKIMVFNQGACPGQIIDFRIVLQSPELTFPLCVAYVIDTDKWLSLQKNETTSFSSSGNVRNYAEKEAWSGMLVKGNTDLTKHLAFELQEFGLRTIPQGVYQITLEYSTSGSRKWMPVQSYSLTMDAWMAERLAAQDHFNIGATVGDRAWPEGWKDVRSVVITDADVEKRLGL